MITQRWPKANVTQINYVRINTYEVQANIILTQYVCISIRLTSWGKFH